MSIRFSADIAETAARLYAAPFLLFLRIDMGRNKLCYAGISAAGFLLTPLCAAAGFFTFGIILNHFENLIQLIVFPVLLICAGAGALHGVFHRIIRNRLQMKTTVYTAVSIGVPMFLGLLAALVGILADFGLSVSCMCFFYGLAVFASATFGGVFMCVFDKPQ